MKAILMDSYGSPDVLVLAEVDKPEPAGDQVLVRVEAASLNTADLDILRGFPRAVRVGAGWRAPKHHGVGIDVAGRVEAVGPDVTRFKPGDEVWADLYQHGHGAFTEFVCLPERAFTPKPAGISFEQAATVPHSGLLAIQALTSRGPIRGQEVLINGAGGCVGPFAIQIAKAMGAAVTGVDHTDKLEVMRRAGADRVADYTTEDVTRDRACYDLILDIAATRSPLRFLPALAPGGRYVLIARTIGGFIRAATVDALVARMAGKRIGVFNWVPSRRQDLETIGRLIEQGKVSPLIDRSYPLAEVPEAFRRLEAGLLRGKAVVVPGGGQ
ncbi:MAG TPA: NAD(P)-dependent alcohol dehydrogenase [Acidimicrobiia bacterium]|nr:NAD(P)-dependent alcohol dehydrogenase [Acidimicrobiia bacterium]